MEQPRDNSWAKGLNIALSGLIGAGKSTLARSLSEELGLQLIEEQVEDNECLKLFYKNRPEYAFVLQISLMVQRLRQQHSQAWTKQGSVQDRSFYEDMVFCRLLRDEGSMTEVEYQTYVALCEVVTKQLPPPDFIIHLQVSPKEALERIKERARGMETGIELDYLTRLSVEYNKFNEEISKRVFVISIDWSVYRSTDKVIETIKRVWENSGNLHRVVVH